MNQVLANHNGEGMDAALELIEREIGNVRLAQVRSFSERFPEPELAVNSLIYLKQYWWTLRGDSEFEKWLVAAEDLSRKIGNEWLEANVQKAIGDVQSFRKEMDAALQSYEAALDLFKQVGDKLGQANVQKAIGDVQSFRDDKDAALQSYDAALDLFKQVGSKLGQANVLLAVAQMNDDETVFRQALDLYEQIRDRYSIARCKYYFALFLKNAGDLESAKVFLGEARELWAEIGFEDGVQQIDEELEGL